MFYSFLSLASIAMALIALFKLITFNPNRTDGNDNKVTRKHLILSIVFFTICSIVIYNYGFNTTDRKEAKYLNSIFEELYNSDKVIKDTANKGLTNDSIDYLVEELSESKESIEQLEPPETLPVEVRDSHDTLKDGLEKIINGIRYNDSAELERGQTSVAISKLLYEKYVLEQSDVKKLINDEYIEGFTLQTVNRKSSTIEPNEKNSEVLELDYEPKYMNQAEWEECMQSKAYTEEECISMDQYYANGEGQRELEKNSQQVQKDIYGDELPADTQTQEESPSVQEDETTEVAYNKVEGLSTTLQTISHLLSQVQLINSDAMSLDINEENANETLQLLSVEIDNLSSIINNPEANKHLGSVGIDYIEQILLNLDEVILTEKEVINDPMSTQKIRIAESVVSEAMSIVDAMLITKIN